MLPGPQMALCVKFVRCGASLPKAAGFDGIPSAVQYRAGVSPPRAVTSSRPARPGTADGASAIHRCTASSETKVVRK